MTRRGKGDLQNHLHSGEHRTVITLAITPYGQMRLSIEVAPRPSIVNQTSQHDGFPQTQQITATSSERYLESSTGLGCVPVALAPWLDDRVMMSCAA